MCEGGDSVLEQTLTIERSMTAESLPFGTRVRSWLSYPKQSGQSELMVTVASF